MPAILDVKYKDLISEMQYWLLNVDFQIIKVSIKDDNRPR